MTDESSARETSTAIADEWAGDGVKRQLINIIECALLRERARGMRDGADVCKELTMATLLLALGEMTAQERRTTRAVIAYCAICIEHRARETEETKCSD